MLGAALWSLSLSGAGCIWNDILDREFDRQVGKNTFESAYSIWSHNLRQKEPGIVLSPPELFLSLAHWCYCSSIWLSCSAWFGTSTLLRMWSLVLCQWHLLAVLLCSQLPLRSLIYRCITRDLSIHEANHILAAGLARSIYSRSFGSAANNNLLIKVSL